MLGNFKEWVMKKRFSLLWSLLAMVVVCACSKSGGSDYPDPEKAGLTFQVTFDKTGRGRCREGPLSGVVEYRDRRA